MADEPLVEMPQVIANGCHLLSVSLDFQSGGMVLAEPNITAFVALTQTKEGEQPRELGRMELRDVGEFVEDEAQALVSKLIPTIMGILAKGNPET
jgi:hypothetical protein